MPKWPAYNKMLFITMEDFPELKKNYFYSKLSEQTLATVLEDQVDIF